MCRHRVVIEERRLTTERHNLQGLKITKIRERDGIWGAGEENSHRGDSSQREPQGSFENEKR